MDPDSARGCFSSELRHGGAGIVLRVAIGRIVFCERQLGNGVAEDVSVFGPGGVEFNQRLQGLRKILLVIVCGHNECPGLFVTAGRRPARGFEQAPQILGRNWFLGEGARTPAIANEFVNGIFRGCRVVHGVFSSSALFSIRIKLKLLG